MKTTPKRLLPLLGTLTNGDLAEFTMYTSTRRRRVYFAKTYPKKPATYHQSLHRISMRHAAELWRQLPPDLKARWRRLARRANLTISHYNLYIYYQLKQDSAAIRTLERQTGIDVLADTGPPMPHR